MKTIKSLFRFTGILFIAVLTQAQSCEEEVPENINSTTVVYNLSALNFTQMLEFNKGILIDLRTAEEYNAEHIMGAVNLDFQGDDFKPAIHRLDREEYYFIYCATGNISETAAEYMRLIGFKKVFVLKDGLNAWKHKNYPTVPKEQKLESNL